MPNYLKNEVVLLEYQFSDLSGSKIRPVVIVNALHSSEDLMVVPLTSRISGLLDGEFVLTDWTNAGLNVETAVKRGIFTFHSSLILKRVGRLSKRDAQQLEKAIKSWLGL